MVDGLPQNITLCFLNDYGNWQLADSTEASEIFQRADGSITALEARGELRILRGQSPAWAFEASAPGSGTWVLCDDQTNATLASGRAKGRTRICLPFADTHCMRAYEYDLENMTQTNLETDRVRALRLVAGDPAIAPTMPLEGPQALEAACDDSDDDSSSASSRRDASEAAIWPDGASDEGIFDASASEELIKTDGAAAGTEEQPPATDPPPLDGNAAHYGPPEAEATVPPPSPASTLTSFLSSLKLPPDGLPTIADVMVSVGLGDPCVYHLVTEADLAALDASLEEHGIPLGHRLRVVRGMAPPSAVRVEAQVFGEAFAEDGFGTDNEAGLIIDFNYDLDDMTHRNLEADRVRALRLAAGDPAIAPTTPLEAPHALETAYDGTADDGGATAAAEEPDEASDEGILDASASEELIKTDGAAAGTEEQPPATDPPPLDGNAAHYGPPEAEATVPPPSPASTLTSFLSSLKLPPDGLPTIADVMVSVGLGDPCVYHLVTEADLAALDASLEEHGIPLGHRLRVVRASRIASIAPSSAVHGEEEGLGEEEGAAAAARATEASLDLAQDMVGDPSAGNDNDASVTAHKAAHDEACATDDPGAQSQDGAAGDEVSSLDDAWIARVVCKVLDRMNFQRTEQDDGEKGAAYNAFTEANVEAHATGAALDVDQSVTAQGICTAESAAQNEHATETETETTPAKVPECCDTPLETIAPHVGKPSSTMPAVELHEEFPPVRADQDDFIFIDPGEAMGEAGDAGEDDPEPR